MTRNGIRTLLANVAKGNVTVDDALEMLSDCTINSAQTPFPLYRTGGTMAPEADDIEHVINRTTGELIMSEPRRNA